MNKEEYIIINKTAIQKRIKELENKIGHNNPTQGQYVEITTLEQILSQSTPLISEIEKACKEANKQFFNQT